MKIPFNKPYITGKEFDYIQDAIESGHISGNGKYTKLCHQFFKDQYGFGKTLLTTSCTDALEMTALLLNIKPGDEVIMPSFTFVSTALAFVRQGAKIVFVDSRSDHPGMDESKVEKLITPKTKAIVVVHYAGVACDMDQIMDIAERHGIFVVEDAAQAIDSYYKGKPLGSIGHLACFSFHETKNIQCGEGGMLVINDSQFEKRAEIIWEKGTNRAAFFRGEIDKYGWVDTGSSFLPSDLLAAFLYAQLEELENIQQRRLEIWNKYHDAFTKQKPKGIRLPFTPDYATNNAHMYYLVCDSLKQRDQLIAHLKENNVHAVFHYQSLHQSRYIKSAGDVRNETCSFSTKYSNNLLRLPVYFELIGQTTIINIIHKFYE